MHAPVGRTQQRRSHGVVGAVGQVSALRQRRGEAFRQRDAGDQSAGLQHGHHAAHQADVVDIGRRCGVQAVGAVIAQADRVHRHRGVDGTLEQGLADYGMHLGTAFQIIDDVLDYSGNESDTGKHLGDDLAEGKPTLPLIYARDRGTPEIAAAIRKAIESGGLEEFDAVLKAVHESGALDAAREAARHEAALARNALAGLPASVYKTALEELADFAVARSH